MDEIAILMAAGIGDRMKPLTEKIPKPLIEVHGKPMIETVIDGLVRRNVKQIYVVVGHLKEQFRYLTSKYRNITLIENNEYKTKNNISSIYVACDVLEGNNCFICETDLYISNPDLFDTDLTQSCYFGKMVKGYSDDWGFERDRNGRITKIGRGGDDRYNMVGVSYFLKDDAKLVADAVRKTYTKPGHEQLFWDEVVDKILDHLELTVHIVDKSDIVEIDTVDELMQIG